MHADTDIPATADTHSYARFPLPGMKTVPEYYGTDAWEILLGGAWAALVSQTASNKEAREAFHRDTKLSLDALIKRSAIDALIDKATGHEQSVIAAFADWVTVNIWGVSGQHEPTTTEAAK